MSTQGYTKCGLADYQLCHSHVFRPLNSMDQKLSSEANRISAIQKSPHIFRKMKVHYRVHNSSPLGAIPRQFISFHAPHIIPWRSIWMLYFHLRMGLPIGLYPSGFPTKILYASIFFPRATCFDNWLNLQICQLNGFGGLKVACWPLVPKFAGSNPAEAVGFLRAKKSSARLPSEEK